MLSTLRPLFLILAVVALMAACTSIRAATTAPSVAAPSVAAPSRCPIRGGAVRGGPVRGCAVRGRRRRHDQPRHHRPRRDHRRAEGKTLYGFTPDTAGVPTCYDECATAGRRCSPEAGRPRRPARAWTPAKLTTVDRTDGTKQVKYGDWPLYYFAGDAAAGDTNGQGVGHEVVRRRRHGGVIGQ